jgi:multidrug efflux pump subunit AcrA (membrane-fusion protein)
MQSFSNWFHRWEMGAALIGCLLVLAGCSMISAQEEPTPTPLPTSAIAARPIFTVVRGEVVKELAFNGRVAPVVEQKMFFRNGGYVRHVFVQWGDTVEAGQVLADLEIGDLENQLAQAEINLQGSELELTSARQVISDTLAEAQIGLTIEQLHLEEAKYHLKNDDRLPQKIAVQIQDELVRLAELRLERLRRGPDTRLVQAVDLARLTVERLQAQVADSSILAPFDGKVLAIYLQAGDSVTAFNQTVMTVYDPTQLEVVVELTTEQLQEMAEGMEVKVKLSNRPGEQWAGIVRRLPYPYGSGGSGTGTAERSDTSARITIQANPEEAGFGLGEIVDVQVVLVRKADVLWLPPEAIRNFEGRRFVVVQEGGRQRRVNVVIGIESERRVEIVDGLEEGQLVAGP